MTVEEDDIEEDLERDYSDDEFEELEKNQIDKIRQEELRNSIIAGSAREEDRLQEYLKKRQELEKQLVEKEETIKQLSARIEMFDKNKDTNKVQEVLAVGDEPF